VPGDPVLARRQPLRAASREVLHGVISARGTRHDARGGPGTRYGSDFGRPLRRNQHSLVEAGRYTSSPRRSAAVARSASRAMAIHTRRPGASGLNPAHATPPAPQTTPWSFAVRNYPRRPRAGAPLAKTNLGEVKLSGHLPFRPGKARRMLLRPARESDLSAPATSPECGPPGGRSLFNDNRSSGSFRLARAQTPAGDENRSFWRAHLATRRRRAGCQCRARARTPTRISRSRFPVSATDGLRRAATPPSRRGRRYARRPAPHRLPRGAAASARTCAPVSASASDYYTVSREWELSAWRDSVSDWERTRYERAV
jgi:hypothetical protein